MSRLKFMGQVMAECDCQHRACEVRGYCMAARIEELEAKLAKAVVALDKIKCIDNLVGVFAACERTLAELKGQDDGI